MKLAYLLTSYPMTSTTFIRDEIAAIEAAGQPVIRFANKPWATPLVDPEDVAERARTEYLLTAAGALAALAEAVAALPALIAALPLWRRVYAQAGEGLARHIGYLVQALAFRRRARAAGVDHVHVHFSTNAATVAMLARAMGGPAYSFTVHGPDELVAPARASMADKVVHAAFVVAITDYCRGRVAAEAPDHADKVIVVPCGIDLAKFEPVTAGSAQRDRLVCVGRLCANKAQVLIPTVIAAVRDAHPVVRIDLVGDGEARGEIEAEIARHGVGDNVRILGWANAETVRAEIGGAAALLLPSLAEGLPIVIMEALAMGRPVITTRIAGIPELVDAGCGWIVPPGEAAPLVEALRAFLATSDVDRAALGAEGRRRIEARHDVRKSAAMLLAAFLAAGR